MKTILIPIVLTPTLAGGLALVVRPLRALELINQLAFAGVAYFGVRLLEAVLASGRVMEAGQFFYADALSAWMVLLIATVSLATSIYAGSYFRRELTEGQVARGRAREFYVLTPWFAAGMLLVALSNNLGVMWVALEGTALASVLLVALSNRKTSLEAAWKYVMLGGVGLALALFGTVFTYAAATQSGEALPSFNWSHLMELAPRLDHSLIKLAFIFILVGYGTKTGLAPLHTWLPDAHSEAPTPTSAMLSGVSLKVALFALLRFHVLTARNLQTHFSHELLLLFGLISMGLAAPFILVQSNLKRLLAYSSLEHIGFICVALGMNTPVTIFAALLHMGFHALAKPVLFFAAGNIQQTYHTLELRALGAGLVKTLPWTAGALALAAAATAGLPPFGMFYTELSAVAGGLKAGWFWAGLLAVAALLGSFCGVLNHFSRLLLGRPALVPAWPAASRPGLLAMGGLLGLLLLLSFWLPKPIHALLEQAQAILFWSRG